MRIFERKEKQSKYIDGSFPDFRDRLHIAKQRQVCKNIGHIRYSMSWDPATGRCVMQCRRCYPHKDSILVGTLYDLLPTGFSTDASSTLPIDKVNE